MVYLILILLSISFVELFVFLRIIKDSLGILKLSSESISVLKSKAMSDDDKELYMRKNSVRMFIATLMFFGKLLLIFFILFGFVYLVKMFSVSLAEEVVQSFFSVGILISLTAATLFYVWVRSIFRGKL